MGGGKERNESLGEGGGKKSYEEDLSCHSERIWIIRGVHGEMGKGVIKTLGGGNEKKYK